MGLIHPKPYKVKRGNEWILITPEPREYISDPFKKEIYKNIFKNKPKK